MTDSKAPEVLNLLELSAKRLTGIADGLLKKYKGDAPQNIVFSLHKTLDELVGEFKGQEKYKEITFVKKYHSSAIELHGEPEKLQRAFGNIIKNAMEAMNFTGSIMLQIKREKNNVVIAIKDEGPGMYQKTLDKVLAGGYSEGKEDGHGIGIQVVRQAVEDFKGKLEAQSEVGKGTTFFITLPLSEEKIIEQQLILQVNEKEPVIIIDDEPSMREQWHMVLAREGIAVEMYACYEEYADHAARPEPCLPAGRQVEGRKGPTAIVDYHFDNSELNSIDIISKLQVLGFQNLYLCTAEYWKPSVQKMAEKLGVALCPKPLPKINVQISPSPQPSPLKGEGEKDRDLPHPNPSLTKEREGYTVLVIDDDPVIRLSWQMIQKKLEIGKLYSFESLEALKKADGIDFAALDFAFVDKNIENSAFDGSQVIDFLKTKGVSKVILASGENEDRLRADPRFAKADFVIGLKVPVSFKLFFS